MVLELALLLGIAGRCRKYPKRMKMTAEVKQATVSLRQFFLVTTCCIGQETQLRDPSPSQVALVSTIHHNTADCFLCAD